MTDCETLEVLRDSPIVLKKMKKDTKWIKNKPTITFSAKKKSPSYNIKPIIESNILFFEAGDFLDGRQKFWF